MFEAFEAKMAEAYPEMSESVRRKIATLMQQLAIEIMLENSDALTKSYHENIMELENHRRMFREHIEYLQKYTKILMESFKKNSMVKVYFDSKTRKNVLKPNTSVIGDTVAFLNKLNELTIEFYENVYKIEASNDSSIQTTLF